MGGKKEGTNSSDWNRDTYMRGDRITNEEEIIRKKAPWIRWIWKRRDDKSYEKRWGNDKWRRDDERTSPPSFTALHSTQGNRDTMWSRSNQTNASQRHKIESNLKLIWRPLLNSNMGHNMIKIEPNQNFTTTFPYKRCKCPNWKESRSGIRLREAGAPGHIQGEMGSHL